MKSHVLSGSQVSNVLCSWKDEYNWMFWSFFLTLVRNVQHPVMGIWADIATDVTNVSCIPNFAGLFPSVLLYCAFTKAVTLLLKLVMIWSIPAALTFPVEGLMPQNLHNCCKIKLWWKWATVKPTCPDNLVFAAKQCVCGLYQKTCLCSFLFRILHFLYQFLNLLQLLLTLTSVHDVWVW